MSKASLAIAALPADALAAQAADVVQDMGERTGLWREYFEEAGVSGEDTEKFCLTFDSPQRKNALRLGSNAAG